jgi:hypothetical protein
MVGLKIQADQLKTETQSQHTETFYSAFKAGFYVESLNPNLSQGLVSLKTQADRLRGKTQFQHAKTFYAAFKAGS